MTTVHPYRGQHWGAAQVGVCALVPLVAVAALGRLDLSAYAAFSSICSVYGGRLRRGDRLRAQLVVGAAIVLAVALGVAASSAPHPVVWAVLASTCMSGLGLLLNRCFGYLPVPSLFLVLTTGTVSALDHTWGDLWSALGASSLTVLFVVVVSQAAFGLRRSLVPVSGRPPTTPRRALSEPGAVRELAYYLLSPAVAGALAHSLPLGHPYWAVVSATVPLAGRGLAAQLGRATLRVLGTAVGIGLAFALVAPDPSVGVVLAAIGVLQVLTELFVTRNYGIAVVFITPMALALGHLVAPVPPGALVVDRLIQTGLGVGVAAAVLVAVRAASGAPRRP